LNTINLIKSLYYTRIPLKIKELDFLAQLILNELVRKPKKGFLKVSKYNPIIVNYFKESFEELKKVTWPTNNQAIKLTIITVVFTIITTLIITGLDFSFKSGYDALTDLSPKATQSVQPLDLESSPIQLDAGAIQATDSEGNSVDLNVEPAATTPTENSSN
jgi:preprotein translocase SecE subunit